MATILAPSFFSWVLVDRIAVFNLDEIANFVTALLNLIFIFTHSFSVISSISMLVILHNDEKDDLS